MLTGNTKNPERAEVALHMYTHTCACYIYTPVYLLFMYLFMYVFIPVSVYIYPYIHVTMCIYIESYKFSSLSSRSGTSELLHSGGLGGPGSAVRQSLPSGCEPALGRLLAIWHAARSGLLKGSGVPFGFGSTKGGGLLPSCCALGYILK